MFPTEFVNCAAKVQHNTLNFWPLWRSIPAWAVITANFTNHTSIFLPIPLLNLTVIGWHLLQNLLVNKASFSEDQRVWHSAEPQHWKAAQICNLPQGKDKIDLFSLGVSLAPIKVTAHPTQVHICKRTSFLQHLTLIYIHPHFHTHATHYFQCAISPSNYRKIHCPLMSVACRGLLVPADWMGENTAAEQPGNVSGPLSLYPGM